MYAYPTPPGLPVYREYGREAHRQRADTYVGSGLREGRLVRTDIGHGKPKGETMKSYEVHLSMAVVPALITRPRPAKHEQGVCPTTLYGSSRLRGGGAAHLASQFFAAPSRCCSRDGTYSLLSSRYCRRHHAWNLRPAWKSVAGCEGRNACNPPNAGRAPINMQSVAVSRR